MPDLVLLILDERLIFKVSSYVGKSFYCQIQPDLVQMRYTIIIVLVKLANLVTSRACYSFCSKQNSKPNF